MAATLRRRDDHAGHYGGRESASEQNREYKEWTRQRRSRTACDGLNSAALDQDVAARIDSVSFVGRPKQENHRREHNDFRSSFSSQHFWRESEAVAKEPKHWRSGSHRRRS